MAIKEAWDRLTNSDQLQFDTDNLSNQAQQLQSLAQELKDAQTSLRNHIDQLRNDWKTAAGDEFFKKFDEDWVRHLDTHIQMLEALVQALTYAADTYEPVYTEWSNIP